MMGRREFIGLAAAGIATAWPIGARAQQRPTIGWLDSVPLEMRRDYLVSFREGLHESGFVVGQNAAFEYRSAQGQYEHLPALAAELVSRRVDVIVAGSNNAAVVAKAVTSVTPIIFLIGADPVKLGLVPSLNRPSGNITGVSFLSTAIMAKRLGLLHDLVPTAKTMAILVNDNNPNGGPDASEAQEAAHTLGLQIHVLRAGSRSEVDDAFAKIAQLKIGALMISGDPFLTTQRDRLVSLALQYSVPTFATSNGFAAAGGLMDYSSSATERYRLVGVYTGRILKGEKPADLPVAQSTKFELVINLKTAKALGLSVPPSLLAIADAAIE